MFVFLLSWGNCANLGDAFLRDGFEIKLVDDCVCPVLVVVCRYCCCPRLKLDLRCCCLVLHLFHKLELLLLQINFFHAQLRVKLCGERFFLLVMLARQSFLFCARLLIDRLASEFRLALKLFDSLCSCCDQFFGHPRAAAGAAGVEIMSANAAKPYRAVLMRAGSAAPRRLLPFSGAVARGPEHSSTNSNTSSRSCINLVIRLDGDQEDLSDVVPSPR
mmetsp:Transcript_8553/g.20754  ORF Transcript_8553/g.20754 Transcript_8553/m.20754 type:complete len:218 (-) Transcript_8553:8-661(-)